MADLLPNPIWRSLSTLHTYLAQGNHLATRYPEDIGPVAGMPEQSAECWEALTAVVPAGEMSTLRAEPHD
jgi:hypothetical protein